MRLQLYLKPINFQIPIIFFRPATAMNKFSIFGILVLLTTPVFADDTKSKLLTVYKSSVSGKGDSRTYIAGLVNMDTIFDKPGDNCSQKVGMIKVEGIQFSESGATLQSFRFTEKVSQAQWSVPTNIGNLSNVDITKANSFIRVGKTYLTHIQVCGSGGFASLISMYDTSIGISPFSEK